MSSGGMITGMLAGILAAIAVTTAGCAVHDPVGGDYFDDYNKIVGGQKPSPPPLIDAVSASLDSTYNLMLVSIRFSGSQTIDPEAGNNLQLWYNIYFSFDDPAQFPEASEFYTEDHWLFAIDQASFSSDQDRIVFFYANSLGRRVYFWITADDGGRESDHSNVAFIDL